MDTSSPSVNKHIGDINILVIYCMYMLCPFSHDTAVMLTVKLCLCLRSWKGWGTGASAALQRTLLL